MAMTAEIQKEVLDLTKGKPKSGESAEDFTKRSLKKLNAIFSADEDKWGTLSENTQAWINKSTQEGVEEVDLLELPEVEDEPADEADEEEAASEEAAEEDDEVEQKPKKAKIARAKPVKAAKPPKEKKVKVAKAKVAKDTNGGGKGRKPNFAPDQKIRLLVDENPHRPSSGRYKRWSKYKEGMTVAQALSAGLNFGNLNHSVKDGHIKVV